jgi:cell fate regulator YaaT (PSP1 superfamily)
LVGTKIELPQFDESFSTGRSGCGCSGCGSGDMEAVSSPSGENGGRAQLTTGVRFGYMRYIGEFTHAPEMKFTPGAKVVAQTQRGIEIGEQVPLTCGGCQKGVTTEQTKKWVDRSGEDTYIFNAGRILREATAADLAEYAHIQSTCREKRGFAQSVADQHQLPLKVAECECTFGGERVIFYFTAAERVDFRAMVKDLAKEYRTRIEMRQIGARDEARLLADFETCGREVCCKTFLKTLKPVSMRMAKLQKATLDPSQVSGRCGRLKCCLRFEHYGYEELDKMLPRNGIRIRTEHGEGVVVNRQILTQLVQIRTDAGAVFAVAAEDITETNVPTPTPEEREAAARKARSSRTPSKGESASDASRQGRRRPKGRPGRNGDRIAEAGTGQTQKPPNRTSPGAPPSSSGKDRLAEKDNAGGQAPRKRRGRRQRRRRRPGGPGGNEGNTPPNPNP